MLSSKLIPNLQSTKPPDTVTSSQTFRHSMASFGLGCWRYFYDDIFVFKKDGGVSRDSVGFFKIAFHYLGYAIEGNGVERDSYRVLTVSRVRTEDCAG